MAMREERANFRFLIAASALLVIAVLVSILTFTSLVHSSDYVAKSANTSLVALSEVHDLPQTDEAVSSSSSSKSKSSSSRGSYNED